MAKAKTAANAFIDLATTNKPKSPPLSAAKSANQSTPSYTPVYQTKYLGGLDPIYSADMSAHIGKMLNTNPWDVMSRNQQIESVSNKPVQDIIVTHGGQAYPRDTAHIAQGIGGASNEGIAKRVQGRFDIASQEGIDLGGTGEVLASPHTMTDSSVNFAMPVTDLYRSFFNRLATPEQFQQLTDELRSKIISTKNSKTGEVTVKKPYAGIPNLDDPAIDKWFSDVPEFRKEFLSRMQNTKKWSEMVGLNPKDVLAAFRDENLIGVPPQYMGHTFIEAVPGAPIQPSKNATYSHDTFGGYRGSTKNTPVPIMLNKPFSEVAQEIRAKWPDAPREDIAKWATGALGSREKGISEMITPEMLRRIEDYHVGLKQDKFPPNDIGAALDYLDLPKFADGGMVDSVPEEAIKNTVRDPQAARLLDLDLAKYALMNQPQRMAGGGTMKKIVKGATKTAMPQANSFDTSHFDSTIVQRAKKDFGDTGKLSDQEYQKALAERANQYRIESILSGQGFNTSGYSNLSGSSYHNKKVGTEYDPKYGWVEQDTHQVRLANHPDYHPPMAEDVKQRLNINHAVEPSTWEDYHISPSMTDEQVNKILSGLNIPNEPDITKAHGGVVRMAQGGQVMSEAIGGQVQTPIQGDMGKMTFDQYRASIGMHEGGRHMAQGGQVQRFDEGGQASLDQMRYELANSPVMQATPRSPMQDFIGTVGGYMDRAGKFVSEAIEPTAEKHPVKHFLTNMLLADSLKGAGTLMQDLTGTAREADEDNLVRGIIDKDWRKLSTGTAPLLDPRALDLAGFVTPVVKGATKLAGAGVKAITPFAKSTAEMAAELYGSGKMPGMIAPNAYMAEPSAPKLEKILDNVHDVVDPQGIEPPHGVRDVAKKDKLVQSMEQNGWVGRPILVFDVGRGNEALTGSHRIAAAKQAGIEIPIYKIDENIGNYADENGNTIFDASYFEEENIVKFLKEFGDKGAAKLMKQEIKANINKTDKILAPANEQGFYSPTEAAALNLQRKTGNGQAFLNDLLKQENVRPDEIKAMGLDTFLKDKKNVTAAEVQDYIAKNKMGLGEQVYKDKPNFITFLKQKGLSPEDAETMYYKAENRDPVADNYLNEYLDIKAPKFQGYSLPGGENYREVVLTLPDPKDALMDQIKALGITKNKTDRISVNDILQRGGSDELAESWKKAMTDPYRSSHFDEPNVLAHLRMSDRVTDGKKTLLVDEVQSDWHQAGREQGYRIPDPVKKNDDGTFTVIQNDGTVMNFPATTDINMLRGSFGADAGVPNAPYKEDWYQLALRRAVKEAIDGGYDRVALPTGARVNERFDLSKQISEVHYSGTNLKAYDLDGNEVISQTGIKPEDLPSYIGKETANKLLEQPKQGTLRSLTGLDLQVGDKGNKKWYDEIYPGYLKKFGKKYGASVGKTTVDAEGAAEPLHYMDITPAMRKEFSTGIHMAKGGKVSFAKSADEMRKELLRNKHG